MDTKSEVNWDSEKKRKFKQSWKLKLIKTFGLKDYLISNFVFRPPQTQYTFEEEGTLRFYPLIGKRKIDIYRSFIQVRSYIIYNNKLNDRNKATYCPILYIQRYRYGHQGRPPMVYQRKQRSPSLTGSNQDSFINNNSSHCSIFDQNYSILQFQKSAVNNRSKSVTDQREESCPKVLKSKVSDLKQSNFHDHQQKDGCEFRYTQVLQTTFDENYIPKVYIYSKQTQKHQNKILIIYSHGNASDLGDVFYFGEKMVKEYDVDFIAYDYTGYGLGLSRYRASEKQTYKDLQYVLSFAVGSLNYNLDQIILWGFSLGSGPTTEIASTFTTLGGVILQAPLSSLLLWLESDSSQVQPNQKDDIYQNINKIQAIKSKILLIHGQKDTIINKRHSQLLYDKYLRSNSESTNIWLIEVGDQNHNDLQQVIENADCDLGKKIFRFFRDIDMERTFIQVQSIMHNNWPKDEIIRIRMQRESLERETTLLRLISEEYNVTNQRKNISVSDFTYNQKQKQTDDNQHIQVMPLDELQYRNRKSMDFKSMDSKIILETNRKLKISSDPRQSQVKRQNHRINHFLQQLCLCTSTQQD